MDWATAQRKDLSYYSIQHFFKATNGSLETLTAALEHTLLHLVFNHPSRYAAEWQTIPVIYGTDVVVNDNLTNLPDGAVTRQLLAFKYNVQLPSNADSNELITLLKRQLPVSSTPKGAHANGQVDQSNRVDAHTHWASFGSHHAANAVKSLLLRAWQETPDHQRGLLPGRARHALETLFQPVTWDWRQLVVDGLGRPTNLRESAIIGLIVASLGALSYPETGLNLNASSSSVLMSLAQ
ncbi:hypothetical protein [Secundilactobacillus kimchicus]|uniref:hypothetical protein n=1 Tax=Secundilactobacillus kimchicus TaxID=528209 RepID=UPI00243639BD|nr:hypothetical protein [Secundilactobacillus kimchicus]